MASEHPVIVVLGSTGNQGRGVVRSLLHEPSPTTWHVRAVTRNPESPAAQELLKAFQTPDKRLSLQGGDMYDVASLKEAFHGAYGVFAVTSECSDQLIADEEGMKHELQAGPNIIDAAKSCSVKHFVFSSLPNMKEVTSGRFEKIFHMDHKAIIERWAREELAAVTCLIPGESRGIEALNITHFNVSSSYRSISHQSEAPTVLPERRWSCSLLYPDPSYQACGMGRSRARHGALCCT